MKAKEIVEKGLIGIPLKAELRVKDGLLNWGTHSIDGARYILGDPKPIWVVGSVERYTNKYEDVQKQKQDKKQVKSKLTKHRTQIKQLKQKQNNHTSGKKSNNNNKEPRKKLKIVL